jgi:hypothetical protein
MLAASTARAEKVGIVVTGEARLQPQLTSQLERWLHDRGHTVVPGALEPDAINTLVDCFVLEDLGCARGVVSARASSRALVYARVEQTTNSDGTRDVSVTGYWFQKDQDAIAERRTCSSCNDDKQFAMVDELMHALAHEPPPPRATDKAATPPAPAAPTGSGETTGSVATTSPETPGRSHVLPYSVLGAGAVMFVGGIVLLAIDEDPDPTGVQSPTYTDTATLGTTFLAVGGAAVGIGVALVLLDRASSSRADASRPVAAISHDSAIVGWAGRF